MNRNRTWNESIYWTRLECEDWQIYVAASERGLCYVGSQQQAFEELQRWVDQHKPGQVFIRDDEKLLPYVAELLQYLRGERQRFSVPLDYSGTPFQMRVWKALCAIPYGYTMTYSDIAEGIEKPAAVRAVGAAIGANPILITIPCHRVIGKNGTLTGYRGGIEMKRKLLQLEQADRSL